MADWGFWAVALLMAATWAMLHAPKLIGYAEVLLKPGLAARYGDGQAPGVTYMDVSALFLRPDGGVDRTRFYDDQLDPPGPPLHPTAQAHERMAEAIEPTLARMMGDRSKVGG